jgi:hypothetical protein
VIADHGKEGIDRHHTLQEQWGGMVGKKDTKDTKYTKENKDILFLDQIT